MAKVIRLIISGRVQGVGYRAWTVATAFSFNLQGWVRNLRDGTVEAVFSGQDDNVTAMIESCKKGPLASRVDGIDFYNWQEPIEDKPFHARPTV
jgi:acylphosphatase